MLDGSGFVRPTVRSLASEWKVSMSPWQSRLARVILGTVLFGLLMAVRDAVSSRWGKVGVAALAGACLGLALVRSPSQDQAPPP
jgi:hypothetical protein